MPDETTTATTDTAQPNGIPAQSTTQKPEPKFTQDELNAHTANTRKEAEDRTRKAILKELGIENTDDPEAVKTVKTKLTAAQKAEEEKLSEIEKATKRAEKAEADAAERDAKIAELAAARIADRVDGRIESLAGKPPFNALDASDVVTWLRNNHKDDVTALVDESGKVDDAKVTKLIEKAKAAKAHWFAQAKGVGSPSISGGRSIQPDAERDARARANSQRTIRG